MKYNYQDTKQYIYECWSAVKDTFTDENGKAESLEIAFLFLLLLVLFGPCMYLMVDYSWPFMEPMVGYIKLYADWKGMP